MLEPGYELRPSAQARVWLLTHSEYYSVKWLIFKETLQMLYIQPSKDAVNT